MLSNALAVEDVKYGSPRLGCAVSIKYAINFEDFVFF